MQDSGSRNPNSDDGSKARPAHSTSLTPTTERTKPEPDDLRPEPFKTRPIPRHGMVLEVPLHDRAQPLPHLGDRRVPPSMKLPFDVLELRPKPLLNGFPSHDERAGFRERPAYVREAQEVKRLRFARPALLASFRGVASKLDQARLLRVKLEPEPLQTHLPGR